MLGGESDHPIFACPSTPPPFHPLHDTIGGDITELASPEWLFPPKRHPQNRFRCQHRCRGVLCHRNVRHHRLGTGQRRTNAHRTHPGQLASSGSASSDARIHTGRNPVTDCDSVPEPSERSHWYMRPKLVVALRDSLAAWHVRERVARPPHGRQSLVTCKRGNPLFWTSSGLPPHPHCFGPR